MSTLDQQKYVDKISKQMEVFVMKAEIHYSDSLSHVKDINGREKLVLSEDVNDLFGNHQLYYMENFGRGIAPNIKQKFSYNNDKFEEIMNSLGYDNQYEKDLRNKNLYYMLQQEKHDKDYLQFNCNEIEKVFVIANNNNDNVCLLYTSPSPRDS